MRVGMRHRLVRFLGGAVQADRMVGVVVFAERQLAVRAVDAGAAGEHQVLAPVVAAAVVSSTFENGGEADQIGIDISKGIDERMSNTGLRS